MSLLGKIFGTGAKEAASVVTDTARGVSDIVERWVPGAAANHEMQMELQKVINEGIAAARQYDPRSTGSLPITEFINVITDAISRLIRPVVTVMLIGAVFGWFDIRTTTTDPVVLGWAENVVLFWFGGRVLFKDVPSLIKVLVELRKGKV